MIVRQADRMLPCHAILLQTWPAAELSACTFMVEGQNRQTACARAAGQVGSSLCGGARWPEREAGAPAEGQQAAQAGECGDAGQIFCHAPEGFCI